MATSTFSLHTFPPFDAHPYGNTGQRRKKCLSIEDEYWREKNSNVLCYDISRDRLLMTLPDTGEAKDYDEAVEALNAYFIPHVNTAYYDYNFRQAKQRDSETLDTYHTRLRQLSQNCSFVDVDIQHRSSAYTDPPGCPMEMANQTRECPKERTDKWSWHGLFDPSKPTTPANQAQEHC